MEYELTCASSSCETACASGESRRFFTRAEKIEMLKGYKETLDRESQGVAERIAQLEKAQDE